MSIVHDKNHTPLSSQLKLSYHNGHNLNLSGPARKNTTVYDTMVANYRTDPIYHLIIHIS